MFVWPPANKEFQSTTIAPQSASESWYFVFNNGEILLHLDEAEHYQPFTTTAQIDALDPHYHLMGMQGDIACYAVEISSRPDFEFSGLRGIFGKVDNLLLSLAGRAAQICDWYRSHQYCGKCGKPTVGHDSDRAMVCETCRILSYPRLSPSIICLIHKEDEVLLARNHRFPDGMYSTLAGFVEPGESIEETLVREVREEVAVEVGKLEYMGSQPWPFPNSLMLGFLVEYRSGEIVCQEEEIADARWFPVNDLPLLPGKVAISRWLIDAYLVRRGVTP